MTEGVTEQAVAAPEDRASSDKEYNFRKLEEAREKEREERYKVELQNQMLQKELEEIKEYLKPKDPDPFDDVDEYIEPELKQRLEAKFAKVSSSFERKAEEIAERKYQEIQSKKEEAEKKNFLPKLQKKYQDFNDVMTEQNIKLLGEKDERFLKAVLKNPDEYEKREDIYHRIKEIKGAEEKKPTIQDKVNANQRNPYHVPASAAPTSNAIDFDLNSPGAREEAYKKLQAAKNKR